MADTRSKALTYLRDQRVIVTAAKPYLPGDRTPHLVHATVRGHQQSYRVTGEHWPHGDRKHTWWCDCQPAAQRSISEQCRHVAAVSLITGWPSAAARPVPEPAPEPSRGVSDAP